MHKTPQPAVPQVIMNQSSGTGINENISAVIDDSHSKQQIDHELLQKAIPRQSIIKLHKIPTVEVTELDNDIMTSELKEKIEMHISGDSNFLSRLSDELNSSVFSSISAAEKHDVKV